MESKNFNLLINKIMENQNIIISKHTSPDWDTNGCAYGLKEIINDNFKNKNVFIVGEKLNEDNREEDELKLTNEIIKNSILITVDVANYERVDFKYKNDVKDIFKIDHHLEVDDFSKNKIIDSNAIACAQIITLWAYASNLIISKKAATYLYFGLITDSARFLHDKTNRDTFEAAKILISQNINIKEIYNELYLKSLDLSNWHFKAFSLTKFFYNNQIAYIEIAKDHFNTLNLGEEEIKSCLNVLSNIKEIKIWFIAYENPKNDFIKISFRSRNYDINQVAKKYNGGGHKLASGGKINNWNEIEKILVDLKYLIDKGEK